MTTGAQSYLSSNDWRFQISDESNMNVQILEFYFHTIDKI